MSPHSSNPVIKIPSKTFLIGEYAVLSGYRALVLTHKPFFFCSLHHEDSDVSKAISFHKDSPAGKLEVELSGASHNWNFDDPHLGAGGFGGSTAEFIAVYKTLRPEGDLADLSQKYFSLFTGSKRPPSGADLVAQYSGEDLKEEFSCVLYSKTPFQTERKPWPFKEVGLLILKTNTKLATHEHLDILKDLDFTELGACSDAAIASFLQSDLQGFMTAVDQFSLVQSSLGLLSEDSKMATEVINKIEGVFTSRGCGAMGADVITVFVKKESLDYVWSQIDGLNRGLAKVTPR